MKKFVSKFSQWEILFSVVFLTGFLGACGGGDSESLTRPLPYASLDGIPNKVSLVACGTTRAIGDFTSVNVHPCGSEYVSIYKVFRSNAELEPFKAELAIVARAMFAPISADAVRPLVDPNYFAQYDLLLVDTFTNGGYNVDILSITETASRVEVCFKRVRQPIDEVGSLNFSSWFSIPKTDKPIVLLPFADWTESTPPPVGLRCAGGAA